MQARRRADETYISSLGDIGARARAAATALRGVATGLSDLNDKLKIDKDLSPLDPAGRLAATWGQLAAKLDGALGGPEITADIIAAARAGDVAAMGQLSAAINSGSMDAEAAAAIGAAIETALTASRDYYADLPAYGADYTLLTGLADQIAGAARVTATSLTGEAALIDRQITAMGGQVAAIDRSITSMGDLTTALAAAKSAWSAASTAGLSDTPQEAILRAALQQSGHAYTGGFNGGDFARFALSQMSGSQRNWGAWDTTDGQYVAKAVAAVSGYSGDFSNGQAQAYLTSSAVTDIQREAAREVFRRAGMVPTFSTGGDVGGGIPGVDSVLALLTPGEKVFSVDHTRMLNDIHRAAAAPSAVAVHIDVRGVIDAVTVAAANTNRVIEMSGERVAGAVARLEGEVARLNAVVRDQSREIRDLSAALRRAG